MEIRKASATSSKSNQLRNVKNIQLESRNITTQPGNIDDRKSEVIASVVNAGMNITANNFNIKIYRQRPAQARGNFNNTFVVRFQLYRAVIQ